MNKCGDRKIKGKHRGNSLFFDIFSKGLILVFLLGLNGQFIPVARAEGFLEEKIYKLNTEADYRFNEIKAVSGLSDDLFEKINVLLDAAGFNAQNSAENYLSDYLEIEKAAERSVFQASGNAVLKFSAGTINDGFNILNNFLAEFFNGNNQQFSGKITKRPLPEFNPGIAVEKIMETSRGVVVPLNQEFLASGVSVVVGPQPLLLQCLNDLEICKSSKNYYKWIN